MMDEETRWNVLMRSIHTEPDGSHGTDWSERVAGRMNRAGARAWQWYAGWHYGLTLLCREERFVDMEP